MRQRKRIPIMVLMLLALLSGCESAREIPDPQTEEPEQMAVVEAAEETTPPAAEKTERKMQEPKPGIRETAEQIRLRYDDARRFIPSSVPYNKTGEFIMKALEYYHKHLERQRQDRDSR